jgi:hypothetical protein
VADEAAVSPSQASPVATVEETEEPAADGTGDEEEPMTARASKLAERLRRRFGREREAGDEASP